MRVAIIGAGLAGLATAYYLLKSGRAEVTLFDPAGVGGGASGVCSGLVHPYPGLHAKRSFRATHALEALQELIEQAGKEVAKAGILRLPISEVQTQQLELHGLAHGDVEKRDAGFWISSGWTIDTPAYLMGLWHALEKQGARLEQERVSSLKAFDSFDQIVIAAGSESSHFIECKELPLQRLKGQVLIMEGSSGYPWSVLSRGYLTCFPGQAHFTIGATFEREFKNALPDPEKAKILLEASLKQFGKDANIIGCRAGIRVSLRGQHLPVIKRLNRRTYLFTGLGSRGLLYHAYFAKFLVKGLCTSYFSALV